jgi:hypothetical protein
MLLLKEMQKEIGNSSLGGAFERESVVFGSAFNSKE